MGSVNQKTISINVLSSTSALNVGHVISSGDSDAYILEVTFGDVAEISGSCQLHFVRGDGQVADRDASDGVAMSGNKVSYTLDEALYSVSGLICYVQFVNSNLYTPLKISFSGIRVVPGGAPVESLVSYPAWTEDVKEAELGRVAAESLRVLAETDRVESELLREGSEDERESSEAQRLSNESARQANESGRVTAESSRVSAEASRVTAESSRASAETARDTAELARQSAENARITAESQRAIDTATAIAACDDMVDRVNDAITYGKKYGVYWDGGSGKKMTRLGDAVGKVFNPWVGSTPAVNDFESIRPWSDVVRCNLADNGAVNAYEGEPGFVLDGSNGQVMLKIPRFYYKIVANGDGREIWVSPDPVVDMAVHPAFVCNGAEKAYIMLGVYMAAEESSKLVSKTGVLPQNNKTISQFRTLGRARGTGWGIMDLTSLNALDILMTVMAANWNAQTTIGRGVVDMPYTSSHTAVVAETAVNRIIVTNAVAANYLAGYQIGIGTSLGGNQIAIHRTITSITTYDASNMAVNFDGAAVNVAVGNILYAMPGKTGGADALGRHTGRAAGTDGKTEINVLGLQGMWGNWWQFVDGVNMDSSYYLWVNDDLATHQSDLFVAPYVKLSWPVASAEGYVRRFGHDPAAPWVFAPSEVGGSSDAPFGDYFYRSAAPANRIVLSGGGWINGSGAGPWSRLVFYASSLASWDIGARLLYKP